MTMNMVKWASKAILELEYVKEDLNIMHGSDDVEVQSLAHHDFEKVENAEKQLCYIIMQELGIEVSEEAL